MAIEHMSAYSGGPEGLKKYAWHSSPHVILRRKSCDDKVCVNVTPANGKIEAGTFFVVNPETGFAEPLTAEHIKAPAPKCLVYFAECEICPDRCRQDWGTKDITLNGAELKKYGCMPYLTDGSCTLPQIEAFLMAGGNIDLVFPSIVY
jgi:hypothetical protein